MNCEEIHTKLAQIKNLQDIPEEMHQHIRECEACREVYEQTRALLDFVGTEKEKEVSPFLATRVMAHIQGPPPSPWLARPAVVSVMSVVLLFLGFLTATLTDKQSENTSDATEIIASEYYFTENPASELEDIWLNSYEYEYE
ncbi:MAG: hypothetical protein R6U46_11425 [Marinilabilia sp.]